MITGTLVGQVAVDSGQIMIIDPCYIENDFNNQFDGKYEDQQKATYAMNYDGCCQATLNKKGFGSLGNKYVNELAIACRTMYGDGVYPVYADMDGDGRVKSLTISFDDAPEDDLCGYCGEELDWDCRCDDNEEEE